MTGARVLPMRGQLARVRPRPGPAPEDSDRNLLDSDAAALGRLMANAYRATIDDHGESAEWHAAEARATLLNHYGDVLWSASFVRPTADADDLIGTSIVTVERGRLLLAFLLVDPTGRGRGVGSHLLARSASVLRAAGYSEWTLAVADGNPARRLYEPKASSWTSRCGPTSPISRTRGCRGGTSRASPATGRTRWPG